MRAYTVATTALALRVDTKWLDNLLSHHDIPGVARSQRGTRLRIPPRSVFIIAIARELHAALSVPVHRAVKLAIELMNDPAPELAFTPFLTLRIRRDQLIADLTRQLDEAAEFAAVPVRGRRPRSRIRSGA